MSQRRGLKAVPKPSNSIQPRFHTAEDVLTELMSVGSWQDDIPAWGTKDRDKYLRLKWREESLLAGAVSSMVQKMVSLNWTITGGRNKVKHFADVLYNAEDGAGWNVYLSKVVQDYLTQDKGTFSEKAMAYENGPVLDLYHIDSGQVTITGRRAVPARYRSPINGKEYPLPRDSVFHLTSLPAPEERRFNQGFCAVSRAIKSAQVLFALYKYDNEQLSDMPPKGIAAITGMTTNQVRKAIELYKENREAKGTLTFPGLLWLASSVGDIKVALTPFSTLPESFDREVVVTLYIYTLALDFGVDAREFWPATVTGATKADALIQAQKAKGKGPGELITGLERAINFHVMPEGLTFKFSFQDDEEDRLKAEIDGMKINNANNMINGGTLTPEEARSLLVSQRVLPEVFATPAVENSNDIEGHKAFQEPTASISYRNGSLDEPVILSRNRKFFPVLKAEAQVEVAQAVAQAIANGSELIMYEGDTQPVMGIMSVVSDNKLYARVILQETQDLEGLKVGVVRTLERFNPPLELEDKTLKKLEKYKAYKELGMPWETIQHQMIKDGLIEAQDLPVLTEATPRDKDGQALDQEFTTEVESILNDMRMAMVNRVKLLQEEHQEQLKSTGAMLSEAIKGLQDATEVLAQQPAPVIVIPEPRKTVKTKYVSRNSDGQIMRVVEREEDDDGAKPEV
jgi:hypothetical protein